MTERSESTSDAETAQIPPTSPIQAPPLESSPQPALEPQQHSATTIQSVPGIVLSNSHHRKYVCIAGRVILGGLATRNARDLPAYRQAYDQLVAFAQDTSHREVICAELAQIGIQHFNLIDVVYELVLMGVIQGARPPIFPPPAGFLGHLMAVIFSFSPFSVASRPRAEQYLFLLQDEAMLLLDDVFGGEELAYAGPGSLALTLWDCLEKHVQQLLLRLQAT